MTMFPLEIARIEEARAIASMMELAEEYLAVEGGVACYGGSPDSWMNQVIGLGMEREVTDATISQILDFYRERNVKPEVEVCPFADPSVWRGFGSHGFSVWRFETVLARPLSESATGRLPEGVTWEPVDPDDERILTAFLSAHVSCFSPGGGPRAAAMEDGARKLVRHSHCRTWVVRVNGELAGTCALEIRPPASSLIAAGVLPAFRGRGIQRALIELRCAVAREAGCTVATIGSAPTSATGRNALRAGFITAYTAVMLRQFDRSST